MPVIEGKYQCKDCEDVFEAMSGQFTTCKCGKSEIEPSYFGYRYRNGNEVKTIEQNTYYLEEEFVVLSEEIQLLLEEIKKIKKDTGYKYYIHEMTCNGKSGERYLSKFSIAYSTPVSRYSSETNKIELNLSFKKEDYEGHDIARKRLQRFLDMMNSIESEELDISKRSKMIELAEKEDIYYSRQSTEEYDYTFYI